MIKRLVEDLKDLYLYFIIKSLFFGKPKARYFTTKIVRKDETNIYEGTTVHIEMTLDGLVKHISDKF